jgi:hypothetical protein
MIRKGRDVEMLVSLKGRAYAYAKKDNGINNRTVVFRCYNMSICG